MNSDLRSLAESDFHSEGWDSLISEKPEVAEALHYLLLMEKHGGVGVDNKQRKPAEVSALVAEEMKIKPNALAANRRKWTNSGALAEARAFLQPIRMEQSMALADMVQGRWDEIVMRALEETLKPDNNIYAIIAGAQFLEAQVLSPARANQMPAGNEDQDYIDKIKALRDADETVVDEEEDYLRKQGGG